MKKQEPAYVLVRVGNHCGVEFANSKHYWNVADDMSAWCRETWGDTDHRTNPNYKWRRSMWRFLFRNESYRTMFMLQWSKELSNYREKEAL